MDRKIIIVCLVLASCLKGKQETVPVNTKQALKDYYPDGVLRTELELVDSIPHGGFAEYYQSGKVKIKGQYASGKLNGQITSFFEHGKVKSIELYVDNLLDGECIYYHETGQVCYRGTFMNGQKIGTHIEYYSNGVEKVRTEFVIVRQQSFVNTRTRFDSVGRITSQTPIPELKRDGQFLLVRLLEKQYAEMAVVICDYDGFFNVQNLLSCDTIYGGKTSQLRIPVKADTVRGIVVNYEWINDRQTISRDIYFTFPETQFN